jgi:hypothetical protein
MRMKIAILMTKRRIVIIMNKKTNNLVKRIVKQSRPSLTNRRKLSKKR